MSRGGTRGHTRVRTGRGRTSQSIRWLERQLNDPYVKRAKAEGYRSRAAYKLIELDEKFDMLKGAKRVVDLGIGHEQLRIRVPARDLVARSKFFGLGPITPHNGNHCTAAVLIKSERARFALAHVTHAQDTPAQHCAHRADGAADKSTRFVLVLPLYSGIRKALLRANAGLYASGC